MVFPSSDLSSSVPTAITRGGGRGSFSNTHGRRSTRTRGTTTATSTGTGGTLKAAAAYNTTGLGNTSKFTKSPRSSTGRNVVGGKHGSISGSNSSITNRDGPIERVVRKWVCVDRAPVGTTFTIRLWVPRDQLTPEERIRYNCHDVVVPMVLGNEEMQIVTDEPHQQQPNWVMLSEESMQTTTTATTTSSPMETVAATTTLSRHNSVTFTSHPPDSASLLNEHDLVNSIPETETSHEQHPTSDVIGVEPIRSLPDLCSDAMGDLPVIPLAADPAPLISSTTDTVPIQDLVNVTTICNLDEGHSTLQVCEAPQPIVDDIAGNGEMDVPTMTTELPSQIVAEEGIDDIDLERAAKRPRYE
jgi:hypothetical protein